MFYFRKPKPKQKNRTEVLCELIDSLLPDKQQVVQIIEQLENIKQEKPPLKETDTPFLVFITTLLIIGITMLFFSLIFQINY